MEKLLLDIESKKRLLTENFESEELSSLISSFDYWHFLPDEMKKSLAYNEQSNEEKRRIIKDNIFLATDFYSRFVARMRSMMEHCPEYNLISFMGP